MSTLTIAIVIVFCIGYLCIALESLTKINKAAIALLMFVATWTLFMMAPEAYLPAAIGSMKASVVSTEIERHLGSTATTLFFLMGAMTIVELVDQNGGFNFVRDTLKTKSKRALLWRIAFMTFRPHHLRLAGHHFCQLGWRLLSDRRRDDHHALEQGRDHGCGRHHGDFHPVARVDGHSCLYPFAFAEGRTGCSSGDGRRGGGRQPERCPAQGDLLPRPLPICRRLWASCSCLVCCGR